MNTSLPRILIAGIGNIFLGDDAFGVEVAQKLLRRPQAPGVRVVDFGIRGLDLVYALADGCDAAIFIDAVPRGDAVPGTLYVLQPEIGPLDGAPALIEAHAMDPLKVLCTATAMGAKPEQVFIVGCEPRTMPADFDEGDTAMGMSPPVFAALDEAVRLVESLVQRIQDQFTSQPSPPKETHTWAH